MFLSNWFAKPYALARTRWRSSTATGARRSWPTWALLAGTSDAWGVALLKRQHCAARCTPALPDPGVSPSRGTSTSSVPGFTTPSARMRSASTWGGPTTGCSGRGQRKRRSLAADPGVRRTWRSAWDGDHHPSSKTTLTSILGCDACATLSETNPHPPQDRDGRRLRPGDIVRVVGAPSLAGMGTVTRAESKPVFDHLVGQYKRITEFDEFGEARLHFRITRGRRRGWHTVWIEPCLLKKRSRRRTMR